MRTVGCILGLLFIVGVQGQRGRTDETDTRLGLVSSQLGVAPVPGGGPPSRTDLPQGCSCIPANQNCPSQILPDLRFGSGSFCPGQKPCCISGSGGFIPPPGGQPNPVPNPGHPFPNPNLPFPNPGGPAPIQLGQCGISNLNTDQPGAIAQFLEFPWMAVILDSGNNYLGAGVLISPSWVLTAAHKVTKLNPRNTKIRLGDLDVGRERDNPNFPEVEVGVVQIQIHPQFDPSNLFNDVALIQLANPVPAGVYQHIVPACLPDRPRDLVGQQCWVSGWGKDTFNNGNFQSVLKKVDVPVVNSQSCQRQLQVERLGPNFKLNTQSFFCAGGVQGKDACTGDGGAPLVCRNQRGRWSVYGLVAWGLQCGKHQIPGVYVNIPNYVNYIRQFVRDA